MPINEVLAVSSRPIANDTSAAARLFLAYGDSPQHRTVTLRIDGNPADLEVAAKTTKGEKLVMGKARGSAGDRMTLISLDGTFRQPNPALAQFKPAGTRVPATVAAKLRDGDLITVTITDKNTGQATETTLVWQGVQKLVSRQRQSAVARRQDDYLNYPHAVWTNERGERFVTVGDITLPWGQRHELASRLCEARRQAEVDAAKHKVERARSQLSSAISYRDHWLGKTGGPRTPLWVDAKAKNAIVAVRTDVDNLAEAEKELRDLLNKRLGRCVP